MTAMGERGQKYRIEVRRIDDEIARLHARRDDPQPSVAVFPLIAIAGGTLMATSVAAAVRAVRTHPGLG